MHPQLETITLQLFEYCRSNNWSGYDPYDALNSELFMRLPFLDAWLPRLALTQILKRSPINFRPLLMIPKTQNPKALGLFLMALLKMDKLGVLDDKSLIPELVQNIITLRSGKAPASTDSCEPSTVNCISNCQPATVNLKPSLSVNYQPSTINHYYCWGYSFPWQGRLVLAPRGEANLVCTVFVANALLDLYEAQLCQQETVNRKPETGNRLYPSTADRQVTTVNREPFLTVNCQLSADNLLNIASSSADYLLNELFWSKGNNAGFSYPIPSNQSRVHNANFLAAALLCRIYKNTGEEKYIEPALTAARYSATMQHPDGGWDYGEDQTQRWIDNFHTGYNLDALRTISNCLNTDEFKPNIQRGFVFYRNHFFCDDGAPKYFHNKTYPIDIHSVAQSIITLMELRDLDQSNVEFAHCVFKWAIASMWDERGYFYYQVTPYYKNKIPYMRWSQAWMLLALVTLLETGNR